jgi:hypothetical protein
VLYETDRERERDRQRERETDRERERETDRERERWLVAVAEPYLNPNK